MITASTSTWMRLDVDAADDLVDGLDVGLEVLDDHHVAAGQRVPPRRPDGPAGAGAAAADEVRAAGDPLDGRGGGRHPAPLAEERPEHDLDVGGPHVIQVVDARGRTRPAPPAG